MFVGGIRVLDLFEWMYTADYPMFAASFAVRCDVTWGQADYYECMFILSSASSTTSCCPASMLLVGRTQEWISENWGLRKFAMNDNNYDRIRDSLKFSSQTMGSGLLAHTPTDTALWMLFYSMSFVWWGTTATTDAVKYDAFEDMDRECLL